MGREQNCFLMLPEPGNYSGHSSCPARGQRVAGMFGNSLASHFSTRCGESIALNHETDVRCTEQVGHSEESEVSGVTVVHRMGGACVPPSPFLK